MLTPRSSGRRDQKLAGRLDESYSRPLDTPFRRPPAPSTRAGAQPPATATAARGCCSRRPPNIASAAAGREPRRRRRRRAARRLRMPRARCSRRGTSQSRPNHREFPAPAGVVVLHSRRSAGASIRKNGHGKPPHGNQFDGRSPSCRPGPVRHRGHDHRRRAARQIKHRDDARGKTQGSEGRQGGIAMIKAVGRRAFVTDFAGRRCPPATDCRHYLAPRARRRVVLVALDAARRQGRSRRRSPNDAVRALRAGRRQRRDGGVQGVTRCLVAVFEGLTALPGLRARGIRTAILARPAHICAGRCGCLAAIERDGGRRGSVSGLPLRAR